MSERLNRMPARERVAAPVFHTEPRAVCPLHPDCECDDLCIAGADARRAQAIFLALVGTAAAIAAGLILWSFL